MKRLSLLFSLLITLAAMPLFAQPDAQVINGARANAAYANDGTTGTHYHSTAKILATTGAAVDATTGDTVIPTYIVTSATGTTGQANLAMFGEAQCVMDTTLSNTAGFYVINSPTTAHECHPQAAAPSSCTWVIGQVHDTSTTSGSAAYVQVEGYQYGCGTSSGTSFDPADISTVYLRDDFTSMSKGDLGGGFTSGDVIWDTGSLGSSTDGSSHSPGAYPHIGVITIGSGNTTTGAGQALHTEDVANGNQLLTNLSAITFDSTFIIEPTNVTNGQYQVGFNSSTTMFVDGCYVKWDSTNSDTNWVARCSQAAAHTDVPLASTPPLTTSWSKIRIWSSVAGTVNFAACTGDGCTLPTSGTSGTTAGFACMNSAGTGGCTASSHLPTGTNDFYFAVQNANSAQAQMKVDFVSLKFTNVGR